jgi:hypothetical protein
LVLALLSRLRALQPHDAALLVAEADAHYAGGHYDDAARCLLRADSVLSAAAVHGATAGGLEARGALAQLTGRNERVLAQCLLHLRGTVIPSHFSPLCLASLAA